MQKNPPTLTTNKSQQASNVFFGKKKHLSFFEPTLQPKLTVNQPNDIYEQEADNMADHVVGMNDPALKDNAFFKPSLTTVQRKCQHCEEEEKLHRKESSGTEVQGSNELDNYVGSLSSSGQALPQSSRSFFEPRFRNDFSNVRVHTDSAAAKSAQSINALAYTTGNNIVFNSGQYSPESNGGKRLIAHELTHVIQQQNSAKAISRVPTKAGAKDGRYNFSANCGWIDWSHADASLALALIKKVQQASDDLHNAGTNATDSTGDFSSPAMTSKVPHTAIVLSSAAVNVRLLKALSPAEINSVALSIFKTLSIAFEAQQLWTDFIGESSYAQEDLPSDLISFYMAVKGYTKDDVMKFCAGVGPDESAAEYDRNHDFKKNKTFSPVGASGSWPTELSTINDSQASALYEVRTISATQGSDSFTFCPMYRIEGKIGETDLFIIGVGGVTFTAADNVRVVPTYHAKPTTSGSYGSTNLIEVEPYSQPDFFAFKQNKLSWPMMVPENILVCLSSKGNKV
ncbi:DUF4157 domain-containing protein [Mucilaginibacter sabulilitoris]|uniref:DUF4157 domain-containing protein n=1 Tax=Mucilaginibacter sabulilitoris TaxID=1173583 RepID=A0ABZ0TGG6_9SPHI|nr:DUF4157 domain-containing protein [Mucilaginibacter sabulilitoris]WPU91353.1 DUF4157 domain-containing protein [Mucilaginibacter sabulilitoris]